MRSVEGCLLRRDRSPVGDGECRAGERQHLLSDEVLVSPHLHGLVGNLFGKVGGNDYATVRITDDHISWRHRRIAASEERWVRSIGGQPRGACGNIADGRGFWRRRSRRRECLPKSKTLSIHADIAFKLKISLEPASGRRSKAPRHLCRRFKGGCRIFRRHGDRCFDIGQAASRGSSQYCRGRSLLIRNSPMDIQS
jgi:hypothetical protein